MSTRFADPGAAAGTLLNAANMNAIDRGINCYARAAGGLFVDISAGQLVKPGNAAHIAYAGAADQAVAPSTTNYVYLDKDGTLVINATGFPADQRVAPYFPLATVVTSGSAITAVNDKRPSGWLNPQVTLTDPGTGVAIPVSGYVQGFLPLTIGAGAETNTIADPQVFGQRLLIGVASVGGGTRAITFGTGISTRTGSDDVATFNAVSDLLEVVATPDLKWALVLNWNSGVALS